MHQTRSKVRLDTAMSNREDIAAMRRQYGEVGLVETTAADGRLSSRTVLLKDLTQDGFTFFSNYNSRKAQQIEKNANVSLVFPWYPLERQVIVIGSASKVSKEESEKYFASRPRGSQIGAWASAQSTELSSRAELEEKFANFEAKWPIGEQIPRPDFWGGYVVKPESIEFWQGRYSRLHDRIRYVKEDNNWHLKRLNP